MSEYVHSGRRFRLLPEGADKESKVIYGACYALFLIRAVVTRVIPWRAKNSKNHESVFSEASSAARVLVTSSFMGL
jgi:hypothetical protein